MFLQQLRFAESFPRLGGTAVGEASDQQCLSSLPSHFGSDLGLQILPCDIVTRLGSDPRR